MRALRLRARRGIFDLWEAIEEQLPAKTGPDWEEEEDNEIRIAVIGRSGIENRHS